MAEITDESAPPHHHHHHHHHNHHNHDPSFEERNTAHWDSVAKTYTSQHSQKEFGDFINKITEFVLNNLSKFGVDFLNPSTTFESSSSAPDTNNSSSSSNVAAKSVRVLDYACGPGTITHILTGRATEFIGLDISPNMVAEYNTRFSTDPATAGGSSSEKINAHAFHANLFDPDGTPKALDDAKFFNFDLVCVSGGYHHFEDLPLVTRRLVERLKPGGVLAIIDFKSHAPDDMKDHPAMNTIAHHGFTEEGIKQLFGGAGLLDVEVYDFPTTITLRANSVRQPFMARGRKLQ